MEEIKHIIHVSFNILEKIGPTLATVVAVYLAYRYAKKQKLFENKNEEYKKVRIVVSNLIQIWRELSVIEFYTSSNDFYAELIFKNPKLASSYFNIDIKRIKLFKRLFHQSKEEIKSINVSLFYTLEHNFMEFNKSLNMFNSSNSEKKINEKEFKEFLDGIFKEIVRDLESVIINTADYLPPKEKKGIEKIISSHQIDLQKTDFDVEIPNFVIDLINNIVPVIEPISKEEIIIFINDGTVKTILSKFFPLIIGVFLENNPLQTISKAFTMIKNPESIESEISDDDFFMQIDLTENDNDLFKNNIAFYKIICALYKKFDKNIPFEFKRFLIKLNNGTINVKQELDVHKAKITLKQYEKEAMANI